jgi:hypothetical protein
VGAPSAESESILASARGVPGRHSALPGVRGSRPVADGESRWDHVRQRFLV